MKVCDTFWNSIWGPKINLWLDPYLALLGWNDASAGSKC